MSRDELDVGRMSGRNAISTAQRRALSLLAESGPMMASSIGKPTLTRILALGFVVVEHGPISKWTGGRYAEVSITDAGRKYLARWTKAYGGAR